MSSWDLPCLPWFFWDPINYLPAVDAAKFLKKARAFASNATNELKENLGPGFEDLQPSDLRPKAFIKKQIANVMDDSGTEMKSHAKIDPDLL